MKSIEQGVVHVSIEHKSKPRDFNAFGHNHVYTDFPFKFQVKKDLGTLKSVRKQTSLHKNTRTHKTHTRTQAHTH